MYKITFFLNFANFLSKKTQKFPVNDRQKRNMGKNPAVFGVQRALNLMDNSFMRCFTVAAVLLAIAAGEKVSLITISSMRQTAGAVVDTVSGIAS